VVSFTLRQLYPRRKRPRNDVDDVERRKILLLRGLELLLFRRPALS
jgi:hypothetical protein